MTYDEYSCLNTYIFTVTKKNHNPEKGKDEVIYNKKSLIFEITILSTINM